MIFVVLLSALALGCCITQIYGITHTFGIILIYFSSIFLLLYIHYVSCKHYKNVDNSKYILLKRWDILAHIPLNVMFLSFLLEHLNLVPDKYLDILLSFLLIISVGIFIFIKILLLDFKKSKLYLAPKYCTLLLSFMIILYVLVFSILSIRSHYVFGTGYYDFGAVEQTIWNTSEGRFFETNFGLRDESFSRLSGHFEINILLFSLFYKVFPYSEALLIFQTILLALGAYGLYLLSNEIHRKGFASLGIAASYLLYPALEFMNLADVHIVSVSTTFLIFTFYFLHKRKLLPFAIFLCLSVLGKEHVSLIILFLGIYILIFMKEKPLGASVVIFSIMYLLILKLSYGMLYPNDLLHPQFLSTFSHLGNTPLEATKNIALHPVSFLKFLFNMPNLGLGLLLFIPVFFIPFFYLPVLLIGSPEIMINMLSSKMYQHTIFNQYHACTISFIFISIIFAIRYLGNNKLLHNLLPELFHKENINVALIFTILFASLASNMYFSPSPISKKFHPERYQDNEHNKVLKLSLKNVPPYLPLFTNNHLAAHLVKRELIYVYDIFLLQPKTENIMNHIRNVEAVFFDKKTELNMNSFKSIEEQRIFEKQMLENIYKSYKWNVVADNQDCLLWIRKNSVLSTTK